MPGSNFCAGFSRPSRRGLDIDRGKLTMRTETLPDDRVHSRRRRLISDRELSLRWGQRKRSRLSKTTALDSIDVQDMAKTRYAQSAMVEKREQLASKNPDAAAEICVLSPKATESRLLKSRNGSILNSACRKNSASGLAASPDRQSYSHEGSAMLAYRPGKVSANGAVRNGHIHRRAEIHSLHGKPVALGGLNMDLLRWPKILISLSYKEKEDDFMVMKGSKLPQRPRRRAKHVEKCISFISPGMWLCDMTRDRYEVREKKSLRRKPRGLKAMGSDDSDSE